MDKKGFITPGLHFINYGSMRGMNDRKI